MKRFLSVLLLSAGLAVALSAQASLTRFAVVDMNRVAAAFAERSPETKAFNEKSARVQAEIDQQHKELQELNAKLLEAQEQEKRDQIRSLQNQIRTKTQALQTYIKNNFAELERERDQLLNNESFKTQLNTILRVVAESEGYSMVLSKTEGSGILWYSPSVDITNKVLERIRTGGRR
jgi:outer membrane protein